MKRRILIAALLALALASLGTMAAFGLLPRFGPGAAQAAETPVQVLKLTTPVSASSTEASGLAWHGDWLIILPQYPRRFRRLVDNPDGAVWAIPQADLLAYLDAPAGETPERLDPIPIPLDDNGLRGRIDDFQGYESIAFDGDTAYLTIEAGGVGGMQGWLVRGRMLPDRAGLELDPSSLQPLDPQADIYNQTDEAVLVYDQQVLTFYEANGAGVNPNPLARRFSTALEPLDPLPLDHLEYRLTDATSPDEQGRFWVMNFFFPGDLKLLALRDPLAARYGRGPTHRQKPAVERLVQMQVTSAGVRLVDRPPVLLELEASTGRNWEGVARLDGRGLLLITDKHPDTVLAFVPLPD